MTRWLTERFEVVHGYDISAPHLEIAEQHASKAKLHHIKSRTDLDNFPGTDLVYSMIVLQHNPPPVIDYILRKLLQSLNPGGFAIFQIPTYIPGYSFNQDEYLKKNIRDMEMHALPQRDIFRIIAQEHCIPVAVMRDDKGFISNTFMCQK
jgi:2-polyprenyl-3-methyl-5-hydroxy-6-metoxy-1,4-benzoquinol methylase